MIPQLLWLGLAFIGVGIHLARNGERREDNYSAGLAFVTLAIQVGLLYWGGFFDSLLRAAQ